LVQSLHSTLFSELIGELGCVWLFYSIPVQDMLDAMSFILGVEAGVVLLMVMFL
jgi:hypothetical protein